MRYQSIFTLFIVVLVCSSISAQTDNTAHINISPDIEEQSMVVCDTVEKKKTNAFQRFLNYFNDANKNKNNKNFDFSVIGGPHYSTDTKFGIGVVAAGLYKTEKSDSLLAPSNVSLYGDVSTVGFYLLGIRGNHIAPKNKQRLDYTVYFYSFPSKFWGIGYDAGNDDCNQSDMKRWQTCIKASYLFRIAPDLFIGPSAAFDYVRATKIERPELLNDQDSKTHNIGVGLNIVYDTRDVMTNPHRGWYINISQFFRPGWMSNDYDCTSTTFNVTTYAKAWKGGLVAADIRGELNFGNPSWAMMALLGSSNTMRGYYEGRYRDKHLLETTIELRQHVWKRNGLVAWVGAGCVFPKFSAIRSKHILPNYGIGYRWEFKKDVNVRLDYGFGKAGQKGFLFNINEAF